MLWVKDGSMRAEKLFDIENTITKTSVGVCHEV